MFRLSFTITLIFLTIAGFAQSPHGVGFKTNCAVCHTSKDWKVNMKKVTFDHNTTSFKLTGQHQIVDCKSCHQTLIFQDAKSECISCHTDMHANTLGPNCVRCHNTQAWIIQNPVGMHLQTRFPLLGNHAVADCSSCHKSASNYRYEQLGVECINCHKTQYLATTQPNHQASFFSENCIECHDINATNWKASNFNHNQFPLTGGHNIDCTQCHKGGTYQKISTECVSCHQANFNTAKDHVASKFPTDCTICHNTTAWLQSTFNHATSNFPLTGAHVSVDCALCHTSGYAGTPTDCNSCHLVQFNGAKDHVASKFPTDCTLCHNTTDWLQTTFDHSKTNFPLTGAHISVDCALCHAAGYLGTSTDCNSCHQAKYAATQTPNHTTAGISVDCKICHTASAWQPSTFNHGTTVFPLVGAHAAIVQCSDCHKGNTTSATADCISCHQVQFNGAKDHVASKFPTDCTVCHNMNNWLGAIFNHNLTSFPLTGAHTTVDCALCHVSGYAGTSAICNSCHQAKYTATQTPNHTTAGISVDCQTCHTTTAWQPSTFNHGTTVFPLIGAHAAIVQCSDCHKGNTTSATTDCISCHQVQFNGAKDHVASKFPTDCTICHNMNNWLGVNFDHNTTKFPLTGGHISVDCANCHSAGYVGISTDCNSCHQTDYNSTTNPNHKTLNLSVTCTDCHTTTPGWQPASFPIHSTYYALTGAHATIANNCAACHKGVYPNTPNTCYACHTTDYNNTTNPAHKTANYSTDCTSCHTTNAWVPSTFNHTTYFPISSGNHNVNCITCHTTPTNYTIFTCVTAACHARAHNQSQGSAGCYRCHPTGRTN